MTKVDKPWMNVMILMYSMSAMTSLIGYGIQQYQINSEKVIESVSPVAGASRISPILSDVEIDLTMFNEVESPSKYTFTDEEKEMLGKLIKAEAGDMDIQYKLLIGKVVLNQLEAGFGESIQDVIFKKNNFSVINNGRYKKAVIDAETVEAVELLEDGWDESLGATFFRITTEKDNWHDRNLEKLFEYKNASFYY